MVSVRTPSGWTGPEYHTRVTFRAPLFYVYRWCTDFDPHDAHLEGETYQRKIVQRAPDGVVYEDLEERPSGWLWRRSEVTFEPPDQWHLLSFGNTWEAQADYRLTDLPNGETRLDARWRVRKTRGGPDPRSKAHQERESAVSWRRFAAALERDYRRTGGIPPRRRQGSRRRTLR
jgi:hypothetical protein